MASSRSPSPSTPVISTPVISTSDPGVAREWAESLAVALLLALLFRGFVAEAFIIPTGSMAPVLTGSHKDLYCEECGARFQTGASSENEDRRIGVVIGAFCENCRRLNTIRFKEASDTTFSGDRIMVSKFHYALHEPKRWDVIVFKYPYNAKQNYIKRLVGLPGETISIRHGDLYRSTNSEQTLEILRKPDDKLLAMRHLVYTTDHQSKRLVAAGFPSRWQPWSSGAVTPPRGAWQVAVDKDFVWKASIPSGTATTEWLRYFHNLPRDVEWKQLDDGAESLTISPYRSSAITDFYAYNGYVLTDDSLVRKAYPDGVKPEELKAHRRGLSWGHSGACQDGLHWAGDLMLEAQVQIGEGSGTLTLDLVEAGRHFQCDFDGTTGKASLWIVDQQGVRLPLKPESSAAETNVRGPGSYALRFANCDNELRLWVDGKRINFGDTTYPGLPAAANVPVYTPQDPGDAAASIGAKGIAVDVAHLTLYRDKYYTAIDGRYNTVEYDGWNMANVPEIMRRPEVWGNTNLWSSRRLSIKLSLAEDQFLPMGDNSPESLDGRCWDEPFVDRNLLTGKALLVFWPHPWYRVLPNFSRMGLIR